jgi:hypothetical protein
MDKDKKIATPGDGTFDFAAIKTAAEKCDNPYSFVERDNAPDPLDAATRHKDSRWPWQADLWR